MRELKTRDVKTSIDVDNLPGRKGQRSFRNGCDSFADIRRLAEAILNTRSTEIAGIDEHHLDHLSIEPGQIVSTGSLTKIIEAGPGQVVLDVGASPSGQASFCTLTSTCASACRARVESGLPVIATIFERIATDSVEPALTQAEKDKLDRQAYDAALADGADDIDVDLPYEAFLAGDEQRTGAMVSALASLVERWRGGVGLAAAESRLADALAGR